MFNNAFENAFEKPNDNIQTFDLPVSIQSWHQEAA